MNKVILAGRLTADPTIQKYTNANKETTIARYTLAVPKPYNKDAKSNSNFIRCVAFGHKAEFAEKFLHKGIKMMVSGRLETGSYEKNGQRHYTTDLYVSEQEFAQSKSNTSQPMPDDALLNIPDNIDEELPFR